MDAVCLTAHRADVATDTEENTSMTSANAKQPAPTNVKQAARDIVEGLPDEATWDDVHYELYVRQKIEAGLQAVAEGRTVPQEQIKSRLMERKHHRAS